MTDTPILYLIFNRLNETKQSFESIRNAKPKQLFIAADGPRKGKPGEDKVCKEVRDYVLSNIDWDCQVQTLFRDYNLGCGLAVSGAITWFFEHVEMGIIVEDDIVPNESFYHFHETLLNLYKDNEKIFHIGSVNWVPDTIDQSYPYTYLFSVYPGIWGWSTWSNRWKAYKYQVSDYNKIRFNLGLLGVSHSYKEYVSHLRTIKRLKNKKVDTWDYQWRICISTNKGISINPTVCLITNIGFNERATHTVGKSIMPEMKEMDRIIHPPKVKVHKWYTRLVSKKKFG